MEQPEIVAAVPATDVVEYSIKVSNAGKLNLADFQNSVPLLREIGVVNDSDREISQLQLRLESFPPFLKPKAWAIDVCDAKSHYNIKDCDVQAGPAPMRAPSSYAGFCVKAYLPECLMTFRWTATGVSTGTLGIDCKGPQA